MFQEVALSPGLGEMAAIRYNGFVMTDSNHSSNEPSIENPQPGAPPAESFPLRVCCFESRRSEEMRSLIERQGGQATVAPSMREVPLDENAEAFHFADELLAGRIDIVVIMTGVGAKTVLAAVEKQYDRGEFLQALSQCMIVVRGPKPAAVLREWSVPFAFQAPEPNTWRELLQVMDANLLLDGKKIAVQEYGRPSDEFYQELATRQAHVLPVPVYRWEFPEDTGPLLAAIGETIAGKFDVLMFTSANQLHNVLQAAESEGLRDQWLAAANKCVIASIGPTATQTLKECGLPKDIEPPIPKMGHLVRETLGQAPHILNQKTGQLPQR